ncbi:MAG: glycosyltransferase family 4 protein [Nitrospirae bacterium]|nr:glycosyltransferase family 4 protein [Nitrospirota bacterium]
MRIGIYAIGCRPKTQGGAYEYFRNLVRFLAEADSPHEYVVFLDSEAIENELAQYSGGRLKIVRFSSPSIALTRALLRLAAQPFYSLKLVANAVSMRLSGRRMFRMPLRGLPFGVPCLSGYGVDAMHFPFSIMDSSYMRGKLPVVLTLHDIQHEYLPELFDEAELSMRTTRYSESARRANVIIAISEHVKASIVEKYSVSQDKIVVTYQGCDPAFAIMPADAELEAVCERYNLPGKFVIYPAAFWPHKNHERLLEAFALLIRDYAFDGSLLLCGLNMGGRSKVEAHIGRLGLGGRVIVPGFVPLADLVCMYRMARMMVFPSLFEGFGIPVVEAMNAGLPVACSDRTSLPEVGGDVALYLNPEDVGDIADKILRLWSDDAMRMRLADAGRVRGGMFTWQKAAGRTIRAYEKLAG